MTNGTTTYVCTYNGSTLTQLDVGSNRLFFVYDGTSPTAVVFNNATYYYVTNLQGDIIALLNSSGTKVVEYTYDAWGNILSTTGSMASTLGVLNPLRYRGYVYDAETGLYYLQSRYYNSDWGRFLNADVFAATGQGFIGNNMSTYCLNNPVNYTDWDGEDAVWIQEVNNVGTMGHSGLLVQDEGTGKWYYFFWGAPEGVNIACTFIGTECACYLIEVDTEGLNLQNTDGVKDAVSKAVDSIEGVSAEFKETRKDVTAAIYFEGNYSRTYEYLVKLEEQAYYKNVQYNTIYRNCAQVSWTAMGQSDERFRRNPCLSVVPNIIYMECLLF